ncbi:hypothetical protein BE221DRAFT_147400 [Ostreococcus tauri]|uniref:Uncharacterized protein n=1 Tax=Ostreococcus tauri TaxID=70448 RepID=A0A1Y5IAD7_OSTTA|nr:hypothetical protein BE221DRAFT_147400 [Ostreococcus tauri]
MSTPRTGLVGVATAVLVLASTTGRAEAVDRRTVVRREIRAEDFETAETLERAREPRRFDGASRGIPLALSADGDDEGVNVEYTEPPSVTIGLKRGVDGRRVGSAAFQWSVIGGAAYAIRRAQTRSERVSKSLAKRFGTRDALSTPEALVGTRWRISADVGRERGTWMPPNWGASGVRLLVPVAIEFKPNGVVEPIVTGAFTPTTLGAGTWSVDGDTLRFNLTMTKWSRGDIGFEDEKLYFKTLAWGDRVSSSKGRLLVNQRRFFIRREWRSVGTFKAEPVEKDAPEALVAPFRVRVPD